MSQKTKQTVPPHVIIALFLVVTIITYLCFVIWQLPLEDIGDGLIGQRSGKKLFRIFVLDPIPDSVTVLHSEDEFLLFNPDVWIHFTIAPKDFDQIQSSQDWENKGESYGSSRSAHVSDWWHPEQMSEYTRYQVWSEDGRQWRNLWVNDAKNEVYFMIGFN